MNAAPDSGEETVDFRFNPALGARIFGLTLVAMAVVVFVAAGAVTVLNLHSLWLVIPVIGCLLVMIAVARWVRSWEYAVRLTPEGYHVAHIRAAGTPSARWTEVEDAVTTHLRGAPCVVLRLKDGRTTTIPVQVLAVDREDFVRELLQHLRDGEGLKPL